MDALLAEIRKCSVCAAHLPSGPRPVLQASRHSKVVIIGQAPGRIVHSSGIPWEDKSGDTLRDWLGVDEHTFYQPDNFALIPMGFCYPGTGKSGDLPPRKECAPLWHDALFSQMKKVKLTLLIGAYAQNYYLKTPNGQSLTDTVRQFQLYLPQFLPLPHPSPRNNIWQAKNAWFKTEVLPILRERTLKVL